MTACSFSPETFTQIGEPYSNMKSGSDGTDCGTFPEFGVWLITVYSLVNIQHQALLLDRLLI